MVKRSEKTRKDEIVYQYLLNQIRTNKLRSGMYINEIDLGIQLNISKTPVRVAILKLINEGLLVNIQGKGTFVTKLTLEDVIELYDIKTVLDGLAVKLCTFKINDSILEKLEQSLIKLEEAYEQNNIENWLFYTNQFKEIYYEASNNKRLVEMLLQLENQQDRIASEFANDNALIYKSIHQKRLIFEAIKECDAYKAEALTRDIELYFKSIYIDRFLKRKNVIKMNYDMR